MAAAMLLMLLLVGYSWRHRSMPGALPFMVGCLFSVLETIGILMASLTADPGLQDFWLRFQSAWLLSAVTAITCFVLEYAWPGRWLTRRKLVLLSILPLFSIFYFLGGYVFFAPAPFQSGVTSISRYSAAGMILMAYSVAMTFVNLAVFAWLFIRSPQHRWPVVLMASSAIFITAVMLREYLPPGNQSFNGPLFILPFLGYAIALYAFRIFDPIPLAGRTAIDQLNAGLIVLDPRGQVVRLNPAAEKILGKTTGEVKGRPVREWLPAYPDLTLANPGVVEIEFSQGTGSEQRQINLVASRLADFRELPVGRLLMLRDVTEQRRAQAQIVEQQRALATGDERERMARELHDSLGQVLSYASFQVGSAAKLARATGRAR